MKEIGQKGGSQKMQVLPEGLLGKIETVQDVKRAAAQIALAVTTGQLKAKRGNTATRALRLWLKSAEVEVGMERIEAIEDAVEQLQRERRDRKPWEKS